MSLDSDVFAFRFALKRPCACCKKENEQHIMFLRRAQDDRIDGLCVDCGILVLRLANAIMAAVAGDGAQVTFGEFVHS